MDVTNAGQDDGLPTSVLREISHLKALDHPNIVKIQHAEVRSELAQIVYEFNEFNLKEYMRKISKPILPISAFSKSKLERPLLTMPIENLKMILY